jgi:hypothetical protein
VTSRQLLEGFGGVEANEWRWTERRFSVALRRPGSAETAGARLTMRLFIPENQIRDLGPLTLNAYINGDRLGDEKYTTPGEAVYAREVPARDLTPELTVVTFAFDKARAPSEKDARELGAIARSVSLGNQ